MKETHRNWIFWIYLSFLLALMWLPLNGLALGMNNFVFGIRIDHLYHATVYLPCAALLLRHVKHRWTLAWLTSAALALTTEFGQMLLPYRGFDINDLAANLIGVSVGALLTLIYLSKHPTQQ